MFLGKKGFSVAVLLLLTSVGRAEPGCLDLFAQKESYSVIKTKEVTLKGAPEVKGFFMNLMTSVNDVLGDLSVPQMQVIVSPLETFLKSHFNPSDVDNKTIFVGGLELIRHPEDVESVFAHEYGHASFDHHMQFTFDGVRRTMENHRRDMQADAEEQAKLQAYMAASHKLRAEYKQVVQLENTASNSFLLKDLSAARNLKLDFEKKMKLLNEQFKPETFKIVRYNTADRMLISYNELYADLVALFKTGNPSAVADAIGYEKPEDYEQEHLVNAVKDVDGRRVVVDLGKPRDFTNKIEFKGWKHERGGYDYYSLFDPSRFVIYKLFLENIKPEDKANFLKAYMAASEEHYTARAERGENLENLGDAEALNREFVKLVVKHAKAMNVPITKGKK